MSDGAKQDPPSLDEFSRRLDAARGAGPEPENSNRSGSAALGRAFRVGSEMLAGLLVGGLLGLGLDTVLNTKPWLLLVGVFLGFAAGVLNVYRAFGAAGAGADKDDAPSAGG